MATLEELRANFQTKVAEVTAATVALRNAEKAAQTQPIDPNADPLAAHQGLGKGITDFQPGGPLLDEAAVKSTVDKGLASIKSTDWLKVTEKVLGTLAGIFIK